MTALEKYIGLSIPPPFIKMTALLKYCAFKPLLNVRQPLWAYFLDKTVDLCLDPTIRIA
jgi:hypothetical protein